MTGWRSRSVTCSIQREANVPTSSAEAQRPGDRGRDERTCRRVGLAPTDTLDRHRRERDERNAGDEDEDAGEVPDHVCCRGAELVPAGGRGVRAEDVVPAAGDCEARERDDAHARGAGEEDGLTSRGLKRPREAALDSDGHEQRRDQRHKPDVRGQRENDRRRDQSLSHR